MDGETDAGILTHVELCLVDPEWERLPDIALLNVFSFLDFRSLLRAGRVCKRWRAFSLNEKIWKCLLCQDFQIPRGVGIAPGQESWREEYLRLYDRIPVVETEVLDEHQHQVLHVAFSRNGQYFTSSSKDGYILVWNASYPATLKYFKDMRSMGWKYTQFSQFNEADSLLLVSGVHFGLENTSAGEIAIFSLEEDFELRCRVVNKPYDVFGCWYNDDYFLSGDHRWLAQMVSASVLWVNKASQETKSEYRAIMNQLYRMYNRNAASVRTLMIANCLGSEEEVTGDCGEEEGLGTSSQNERYGEQEVRERGNPVSHRNLALASAVAAQNGAGGGFNGGILEEIHENPSPIRYTDSYRQQQCPHERKRRVPRCWQVAAEARDPTFFKYRSVQWLDPCIRPGRSYHRVSPSCPCLSLCRCDPDQERQHPLHRLHDSGQSELQPTALPYPDANFEDEGDSSSSEAEQNHRGATAARPSSSEHDAHCTYRCYSSEEDDDKGLQILDSREKYLIFTTGSKTYTPHQIGFKRIRPFAFVHHMDPGPSLSERVAIRRHRAEVEVPSPDWADFEAVRERFDEPDKLIDLQGHIIGMCLSPDQRYLYVNSRPWPKGYVIEDPFRPPPIAQEIDIHVIDMVTLEEVGTMVRAHNSFTPNDECFFIFLDVSDQYVASGSDDKHGYLWDRHYGVCLAKLPHDEVVNSVAICPSDPEVLITASDDRKIKIWRSRRRSRQIFGKGLSRLKPRGVEFRRE